MHWEHLPIALFPDKESDFAGRGDGYMWSGSAMVYHSGMSADIDSQNWFANGGGDGLLGFSSPKTTLALKQLKPVAPPA